MRRGKGRRRKQKRAHLSFRIQTEIKRQELDKWKENQVSTVSPLHMNLLVVNFQRRERTFACPIT